MKLHVVFPVFTSVDVLSKFKEATAIEAYLHSYKHGLGTDCVKDSICNRGAVELEDRCIYHFPDEHS